MVTIGRWRQNRARQGIFVRRALSRTLATSKVIAAEAGFSEGGVCTINNREKIRPRELAMAIGRQSSRHGKKISYRRINAFSEAKKTALLEAARPELQRVFGGWWKNGVIKKEYGKFEEFSSAVDELILKYLDYFDPFMDGKKGKVKVKSWILGGARIFCLRLFGEARKKSEMEKNAIAHKQPVAANDWLSRSARLLFLKLGMDPEYITRVGSGDVIAELKKTINGKRAGLTQMQKKVVLKRLDGWQYRQIAVQLGYSPKAQSSILVYEKEAVAKIRKAIGI